MKFEINIDPELLNPPVKRAAYSDRTAWLMAAMSLLAYVPFEAPPTHERLLTIAKALAGENNPEKIVPELAKLATPGEGKSGRLILETELGRIGFELIETFSVSIGMKADTQAFLARIKVDEDDEKDDFLVLSFRGTQPTRMADIKSDLDAVMIEVPNPGGKTAKVHRGFYDAFDVIKDVVNGYLRQHPDLPVYITGHSLGGALAFVTTRFIANRSLGACYTFGAPRAGNEAFCDQIFTPVYRIVNASDAVPSVPPPAIVMSSLGWVARRIPLLKALVKWIDKMSDYRHSGDQRHLSFSNGRLNADGILEFENLRLRSDPTLVERFQGFLQRHNAPLADHSIETYVAKLAWYAKYRAVRKLALNSRPDHSNT